MITVSEPFPNTALRRRHAQTVRDTSSSYKIDYAIGIRTFLNPEGHPNPITGSKVTAILLKGWILPIGGISAVEGLRSTGLHPLVPSLYHDSKSIPWVILYIMSPNLYHKLKSIPWLQVYTMTPSIYLESFLYHVSNSIPWGQVH